MMGLFRRNKNAADQQAADAAAAEEAAAAAPVTGPWDVSDEDRADADLPRLDLGSLRIPGLPEVDLQVEAEPATGEIAFVTAVAGEAAVQLQAFAAPRSMGLWEEVRAEMLAELTAGAAQVQEVDGPFGPELRALIPAQAPDGRPGLQPVRFAGIDGPRWFLRVVFLGRAAVEPDPADDLHRLVRETIVVRGSQARAPREQLPMQLPAQAHEEFAHAAEGEEDEDEPDYSTLDPFERGPEITEIR